MKKQLLLILTIITTFCCNVVYSQQSITLTSPGTASGGISYGAGNIITFSVRNNNPGDILITDMSSFHYQSSGTCSYDIWYIVSPNAQATSTTATNVTTAPWLYYGPTVAVPAPNGTKPFLVNANLTVPGNSTMRIAIVWTASNINGSTVFQGNSTGGLNIVSAGGVDLLSGASNGISNSLRGSYPNANATSYNWIGSITWKPKAVPCNDTVESAIIIGPNKVCPNKDFNLKVGLSNGLALSGMSYQWQYSTNFGLTWLNHSGTPNPNLGGQILESINKETWYRCNIVCIATSESYTTPIHKVTLFPFYYCYCDNEVDDDGGADIGNLTIINSNRLDTIFDKSQLVTGTGQPVYNNKDAIRTYTGYHDSLAWLCLYKDTNYIYHLSQIQEGGTLVNGVAQGYIDYNRDGLYDPNNERIFVQALNGTGTPVHQIKASHTVPSSAEFGPTGLRVIISEDTVKGGPCGVLNGGGEVEDYIVEICHRPCDAPVNAGVVVSIDSTMCAGYSYVMHDTTYEQARSGFTRSWEVSGDNITWMAVPNSTDKDTIERSFLGQPLYYRLRTICVPSHDTNYSAATLMNNKPGYKCYCYSKSEGGLGVDTSDVGGVRIAGYSSNAGGPHLLNAKAIYPRTDYTDMVPLEMFTDSAYSFELYHTMPSVEHGDAKITVFMDFNNNHEYDIPEERIFTGFTSIGNHTLIDSVVVPFNAITDVPTGMRVIVNNDVGPNIPSDEGCGGYQSGETEDYVLIFRKKWRTGIEGVQGLTGFNVHPNPTSGKFNVHFSTDASIDQLAVRVTNVTGQLIHQYDYKYEGGIFDEEIDMTGHASGVYFVELEADGERLIQKLIVR